MPVHGTAQLPGGRSFQCDAVAAEAIGSFRAYALLDGIGDSPEVAEWTRATARAVARSAALCGSAESALRYHHRRIANEPGRLERGAPKAVAVVAVAAPARPVAVAWCGDARAYHFPLPGRVRQLTVDHNERQEYLDRGLPFPGSRHLVTSYLGDTDADPVIGSVACPALGRLLLVSDGAYEPLEESHRSLGSYVGGAFPQRAAEALVTDAVELAAAARPDNASAVVVDLDRSA